MLEKKVSASHEPNKVQKIRLRMVLKKPTQEHVPHLRGHKNREDEYFLEPRNRERVVKFEPEVAPKDAEIKDVDPRGYQTKPKSNSRSEPGVKPVRQQRMVKKLTPDPQKVIQTLLDTLVSITLRELLGNMPEVKKSLFQTSYTPEDFQKLEVGVVKHNSDDEDTDEAQPKEDLGSNRASEMVNAVAICTLPDYMLVEAKKGKITRYYRMTAKH
jgi:hypothetical protein